MIKELCKLPFYIKKLNPKAIIPKKGSPKAAGYDICSCENIIVPKKDK